MNELTNKHLNHKWGKYFNTSKIFVNFSKYDFSFTSLELFFYKFVKEQTHWVSRIFHDNYICFVKVATEATSLTQVTRVSANYRASGMFKPHSQVNVYYEPIYQIFSLVKQLWPFWTSYVTCNIKTECFLSKICLLYLL